MPKGYWIAHVDVFNPERYPGYMQAARPAYEKYGANSLSAAVASKRLRERRAGVMSSLNLRATIRPSPAIARPSIRRRLKSGARTPRAMS